MQVMPQVAVCLLGSKEQQGVSAAIREASRRLLMSAAHLVEAHELRSRVLFGLVEGLEADISGRLGCVGEGPRDGVKVMGPNGHQGSLPAHNTQFDSCKTSE